jgi:hypothetical protein
LIPGFYTVRVQKQGFKVAEVKGAEVLINKTTSIRVTIEPGELTQTVEVAAPTFTVDTTSSSVNEGLPDTFLSTLPLGRGVAGAFYLSPGVANGLGTGHANPSISGSTGLENLYLADGVALNDPSYGGLGVFSLLYGPLGTGITESFIKEVEVKTGGFEPQYGRASGGIVQMVTKSGGTETHGTIGAYVQMPKMQSLYENSDDYPDQLNLYGKNLEIGTYEGDFELGGHVPGFGKHLFYFGTFAPTSDPYVDAPAVGSGLFTIYKGQFTQWRDTWQWAGKLTWNINDKNTIESSAFGDPSETNNVPPPGLWNANNTTVNSHWNYGSRSWATRYNGTLGSTLLVDVVFRYNWNDFTETPAQNIYQIEDLTQTAGLAGQRGAFFAQGFGFLANYQGNTRAVNFDVSKIYHFGGQHTFSFGYDWEFPVYNAIQKESGPTYAIPSTNFAGASDGAAADAIGKMSDANFQLVLASSITGGGGCTQCPLMNVPGYSTLQPVALYQVRGRFDGGLTASTGKDHAAYANDSWQMGTHVTLSAGVRWEQQRLTGNQVEHVFNDMWEPRIGFIVDPKGDRKSKIYANFGRYAYELPLDMAVRSLSEEEDSFAYFAPAYTTNGSGQKIVTLNSLGTVTPILNAAHLLNESCPGGECTSSGGIPQGYGTAISGGEPFGTGTRMEYTDEFVVGADHQFRGGVVGSVKFIDRRLKRIIEDQGGISVEQFEALAYNGGSLNYFIGNPSATSDYFVNPNEITFSLGQEFTGGELPAACYDNNGYATPYVALNMQSSLGVVAGTYVGSACFPSVNMNPWTNASTGAILPGALFGGEEQPDGKPDGYKQPERIYDAVEFEVNKSFSHNWQMVANWRIATLHGNYEGAYRNDNGQSDPGISSLFDFTNGDLGLLGCQQCNGPLNTDRRHIVNVFASYVLDRSKLKGMTFGTGLNVQSGVPLTSLAAQEAYGNPGEVPINGRGDLGRAPVTGTIGVHVDYPIRIGEGKALKLGIDLQNIANTKRELLINQDVDLSFGIPNVNFMGPAPGSAYFVAPFSARALVLFTF